MSSGIKEKAIPTGESLEPLPVCAYLFDVDGVLTNPWTKKIEQEDIFTQLQKRIEMGMIVCLNSGRAENFLVHEILDPLSSRLRNQSSMSKIVAIGEKGGVLMTYDQSGQRTRQIETDLKVPKQFEDRTKILLQKKYSDTMFFDDAKLTMVTLEARLLEQMGGKTPEDFRQAQKTLCTDLQILLDEEGLSSQFRVDPTGIATDIQSVKAGKAYGTDIFIKYLHDRRIAPTHYKCFGDSTSDIEMHQQLIRNGLYSEFIYVGNREHLIGINTDGIIFMQGDQYDRATLKYLSEEEFIQK